MNSFRRGMRGFSAKTESAVINACCIIKGDMTAFADAHIHITEPGSGYADLGDAELLFGCTARRSEWTGLSDSNGAKVVRFYGVHPWYADEWGPEAEAELRSFLSANPDANVGEIGLDSKRGNASLQEGALESQLAIASEMGRTANIHMVGCEKDVLDVVRSLGRGCRSTILHSFSSESYVRPFVDVGCMISLNPRIMVRSPERIRRLTDAIPEDLLLLETDSPYTARGFVGMGAFAVDLARIMGTRPVRLLESALENARRAVHVGHK